MYDPIVLARQWFDTAKATLGPDREEEATAMALATTGLDGKPSVRYVLLKGLDERGFVFYTNYESVKGVHLAENPVAAIAMWWPSLGRQLRASGPVERLSGEESDAYFATRPRASQIGAWASDQSRELADPGDLERRVREVEQRFLGQVPRPPHWGGYLLRPDRIEFWTAREGRLHERVLYVRIPRGWRVSRLFP